MTSHKSRPGADALAAHVKRFRAMHPAEWEACRRWPTESGLRHIIEVLRR